MDFSDFVYLGFFALWLYSQIKAVAKKNRERQQQAGQQPTATPLPPVAPRPAPPSRGQGEGLLSSLSDLEQEIEATLLEIDEKVRAQVSFLVDHDYRDKAQALESELRNESSPEFVRASQETQWLLSHYRGLLQTARVHSGIRQRRELQGPRVIADSVAAELDQPRNVEKPLPPPVAIVWDVAASDRLRESALADATLFVRRTVVQDPSHWFLMAPEIAHYLSASAPTLYQDIYQGLELGAAEAQVGNDPAALTRVLFASWMGRIVSDAMGALFFGPSYLHSIAELYAPPAQVTSIVLNQDGTVHTEPPAHVRVHVTARWLTRMGYAAEATEIQRQWDERHGSPDTFGFWGSMTSLPVAPVLAAATQLTDELFQLPLDAFGNVRLAHVPGLAGWESHARQATGAKASLLAGERAQGSARAIVAGAIEAALARPEANTKIHAALYESLSTVHARAPKPTAPTGKTKARARTAKPVATGRPFAHLTGRDVAEALILGEILLEPRAR